MSVNFFRDIRFKFLFVVKQCLYIRAPLDCVGVSGGGPTDFAWLSGVLAWMLDVLLYFTASFFGGGVHGLWSCDMLSANNIGERH